MDSPSPSATVVLLRDAPSGNGAPEILLVLRHARTAFGATYVFPGGVLEREDSKVAHRCDGLSPDSADAALLTQADGMAYYSAAARELFEEAGVLLARTSAGSWADTGSLDAERDALNAGSLSWVEFLERHDLRVACDALHYFSYWITPRAIPRRFSTRFFAAALPARQVASHCGGELTDSRWLSATAALEHCRNGGFDLPHPTRLTLEALAGFPDTGSVLSWAGNTCRAGVDCVLPIMLDRDGERRVLMPGDPDYAAHAEAEES